ncbi:MAG: hypothetical protein ACTHK5_10875 [Tsuneonella sp.]
MRIPSREVEAAVVGQVAEALDDPLGLLAAGGFALHANEIQQTIRRAAAVAEEVRAKDYQVVRSLIAGVQITPAEVRIDLAADALTHALSLEEPEEPTQAISLVTRVRLTRTGRAVRLIDTKGNAATAGTPDPGLVALLVTARRWWARIATGEMDIATLCREEGVNDSWNCFPQTGWKPEMPQNCALFESSKILCIR